MPDHDEFSLIKSLFAPLAASFPGALGLTDDAALLDGPGDLQWVVTSDAMVAGVHFLADDPPDLIARKLFRVNLSDVAAMGATPVAVLLASSFPRDVTTEWLERFANGMKTDCALFGIALIGGDTVATPGPLTLALTALGQVPRGSAILRSNARSGDDIWISGSIGDAAIGLLVALGQAAALPDDIQAALLNAYRLPSPRTALGPALRGLAHAAMDVSDGLVADLGHICEVSGVGATLDAEKVPLSRAVRQALDLGVGDLTRVLTGGDDYELLFSAAPDAAPAIEALGRAQDLPLTRIGRIITGNGIAVVGAEGRTLELPHGGYRHFGG